MAGIYDSSGGAAIVTRASEGVVAELHDRMPVLLQKDAWKAWVDPNIKDASAMLKAAVAMGSSHIP